MASRGWKGLRVCFQIQPILGFLQSVNQVSRTGEMDVKPFSLERDIITFLQPSYWQFRFLAYSVQFMQCQSAVFEDRQKN